MSTDKNNKSDEFDKTAQSLSGSNVFKSTPGLFSGDSTNEKSRSQCITSAKEFNEKSVVKLQLEDDEAGLKEREEQTNGLFSESSGSLGFIDPNKPTSTLLSQPSSSLFGGNNKTSLSNPTPTPSTKTGGVFGSTTTQSFGKTATSQLSFGSNDLQPASTPLFGSKQNANRSLTPIIQLNNTSTKEFNEKSFEKLQPKVVKYGLEEPEEQTIGLFSRSSESLGFIDPNKPTTSTLFSQPASSTFGENKTSLSNPTPTPSTKTGGLFGSTTTQSFGKTATSQSSFGSNDLKPASTPLFGSKQNANVSVRPIIQPASSGCGLSFNTFNGKAPTEQQQQQPTQFGPTNNNNSISKFSYNPSSIPQTKPAFGITSFSDSKKPLDKKENLTSWCVTHTFVKKDSFRWTIENFRYRTEARGESIESSIFTSGQGSECEHNWRFDIYPNGYYDSSMDFVGLKINLLDDKHPHNIQVTMKISILNSYDNPVHTVGKNAMTITIPETGIIYCPNFLNKQEIINNSSCLLSNDNLKILFEIGTLIGTSTKSKKIKQAYSPKDQLRDQIFKYFNSDKLSDVVIEVDGTEIKAHKLILSTQSSIFAAMFDEEVNKNRIKIDDMKLDVAKQLLEFIYTNKKPTKINEFTTELIIAAQKYQIAGLRIMCEEILFDSLSIDNAIKILLLAHKHDINKLKDFVIEFIQTNGSILRSNEFKDLENEHPALAMEVYRVLVIEKADN